MTFSRMRVAAVAPALSSGAIALPAASASAAPSYKLATSMAAALPVAAWGPGWGAGGSAGVFAGAPATNLSFVGPSVGQVAAVIGPTIITTAPSTFINTNNQVSAGGAVSGGQASGPTAATG